MPNHVQIIIYIIWLFVFLSYRNNIASLVNYDLRTLRCQKFACQLGNFWPTTVGIQEKESGLCLLWKFVLRTYSKGALLRCHTEMKDVRLVRVMSACWNFILLRAVIPNLFVGHSTDRGRDVSPWPGLNDWSGLKPGPQNLVLCPRYCTEREFLPIWPLFGIWGLVRVGWPFNP